MAQPIISNRHTNTPVGNPSLLEQLADFAHSIRWQCIPDPVRHAARFNVLDTIACMASGAGLEESQQLLDAERRRGDAAEASVMGAASRVSVEAAARVNAYMGDIFELNDLIAGHASIATVPPALALAEAQGASGQQLLEAVVAGIEIVCRVHGGFYAYQKPFTETGMVQVTVASAIGAAVTAARLLKLDRDQTLHAEVLFLHRHQRVREVPIMDCVGTTFLHAELMVNLRRRTGLEIGRVWEHAKPDATLFDAVRRAQGMDHHE